MSNLERIPVGSFSGARYISLFHNVQIGPEGTTPIRKRFLSHVKGYWSLNFTIHPISFRGYRWVKL